MNHIRSLSRSAAGKASGLFAFAGVLLMTQLVTHADVLRRVMGNEENTDNDGGWGPLITTADKMTDEALIPVIAVAPLAAVAGGVAMMVGGGGQRGNSGVKLIAGAIGAVLITVAAQGFAE